MSDRVGCAVPSQRDKHKVDRKLVAVSMMKYSGCRYFCVAA